MRRNHILLASLVLLAGAMVAAQDAADDTPPLDVPPATVFDAEAELERLAPSLDDADNGFSTVRQFDRVQRRLAAWDLELAEQYDTEGDPDLARVTANRAEERVRAVARAYERILQRNPKQVDALNFLGELQYDWLGDQAAALENWEQAAALDETAHAPRNNLAIHLCHVGEYEKGLQRFDEVMALDPDNPDYLFNLAQIYLIHPAHVQRHHGIDRQEVYRRAMAMSRRAAELQPGDYALAQDYAVNYFAAENFGVEPDWREAAAAWQRARETVRRSDQLFFTWLNEARAWLRAGTHQEAARCLREALAIMPDSDVAQRLLEQAEAAS